MTMHGFRRRFLSVKTGDAVDPSFRNEALHLVRVMQWNILADALSHSTSTKNFVRCSEEVLSWPTRRQRILSEILLYSPDLVCLEEVDHFRDYFSPKLNEQGYSSHFLPKPDSPCLRVEGNNSPDGCAIFVKKDRLEVGKLLEIAPLKDGEGADTNQVAILAGVNDLRKNRRFVAGVTHLKAKEGNESIRAAQGKDILGKIEEMKRENGVLPIVLCGDFNATPDEPVYKEMRNNGFESSYLTAAKSEPAFTTWKYRPEGEVRRTIDYVWHSPALVVHNYLEIPSQDVIGKTALPSLNFPSDHVSLVFDFELP